MDSLFIQHDILSIPVVHFDAHIVPSLANGSHVKMAPVSFIISHVVLFFTFSQLSSLRSIKHL